MENFDPTANNLAMTIELDLLDEKKEQAKIRIAHYKDQATKFYNKNVQPQGFNVRDLVLRRALQNTQDPNAGKLAMGETIPNKKCHHTWII